MLWSLKYNLLTVTSKASCVVNGSLNTENATFLILMIEPFLCITL